MFVAKLDSSGSLLYTALLEGGALGPLDSVTGVAADAVGRLFVTGSTGPPNSGFVTRFSADGSAVEYSTNFVGGASSIAVDAAGNAIVISGLTLIKLDTSGSLVFSKQLIVLPARVAADAEGNIYVTGAANGSPPVTADAYQKSINIDCPNNSGGLFSRPSLERPFWMTDAYVFKLIPDGSALQFATLLGGSCRDVPSDLAVAPDGSIWIAGTTYSDPFPSVDPIAGPPPPETAKPFFAHLDAAGSRLLFSSYIGMSTPPQFYETPRVAAGPGGSVYIAVNGYSGPAQLWKISPTDSPAPFAITRVTSAFSHSSIGVSPVDIVELTVPGLAPAQDVDLGLSPPGGAPLELAGVSVTFNGFPASLLAVQQDRVVCITPAELSGATVATVQVKSGGAASHDFTATVQLRDLAFFPQVRNEDGSLNSPGNPEAAGSTISLFVTGAGWPPDASLQLAFGPGGPSTDINTLAPVQGFVNGIYEIRVVARFTGTYKVTLYHLPQQFLDPVPPSISVSVR